MPRKIINWESVEKAYRLGQKSMRNLADECGVNVSTISRRAKKYNWVQDKSGEIRQRTSATLISQHGNTPTCEDINVAVQTNVKVIENHRSKLKRTKCIADILLDQLEEAATNREDIESEIIKETADDKGSRRRNMMLRAVALPAHASTLKDISYIHKNVIPLERQNYNIDERTPTGAEDDPIHVRHSMDNKGLTRALEAQRVGPLQIEEGK